MFLNEIALILTAWTIISETTFSRMRRSIVYYAIT